MVEYPLRNGIHFNVFVHMFPVEFMITAESIVELLYNEEVKWEKLKSPLLALETVPVP